MSRTLHVRSSANGETQSSPHFYLALLGTSAK